MPHHISPVIMVNVARLDAFLTAINDLSFNLWINRFWNVEQVTILNSENSISIDIY